MPVQPATGLCVDVVAAATNILGRFWITDRMSKMFHSGDSHW